MTKHPVCGTDTLVPAFSDSPIMRRYAALREEAGCMLAFQLGDFFEIWGADAAPASELLNVALSRRGNIPMCGFPADSRFSDAGNSGLQFIGSSIPFFGELVQAGHIVAIARQIVRSGGFRQHRIIGRVSGRGMVTS